MDQLIQALSCEKFGPLASHLLQSVRIRESFTRHISTHGIDALSKEVIANLFAAIRKNVDLFDPNTIWLPVDQYYHKSGDIEAAAALLALINRKSMTYANSDMPIEIRSTIQKIASTIPTLSDICNEMLSNESTNIINLDTEPALVDASDILATTVENSQWISRKVDNGEVSTEKRKLGTSLPNSQMEISETKRTRLSEENTVDNQAIESFEQGVLGQCQAFVKEHSADMFSLNKISDVLVNYLIEHLAKVSLFTSNFRVYEALMSLQCWKLSESYTVRLFELLTEQTFIVSMNSNEMNSVSIERNHVLFPVKNAHERVSLLLIFGCLIPKVRLVKAPVSRLVLKCFECLKKLSWNSLLVNNGNTCEVSPIVLAYARLLQSARVKVGTNTVDYSATSFCFEIVQRVIRQQILDKDNVDPLFTMLNECVVAKISVSELQYELKLESNSLAQSLISIDTGLLISVLLADKIPAESLLSISGDISVNLDQAYLKFISAGLTISPNLSSSFVNSFVSLCLSTMPRVMETSTLAVPMVSILHTLIVKHPAIVRDSRRDVKRVLEMFGNVSLAKTALTALDKCP